MEPLYLQDALLGLRSEDHKRYNTALRCLPKLVDNNDVKDICPDLLQTLFRAQNKFEEDDFLENKYKAMVSVILAAPKEALLEIGERITFDECSMGERLCLVEVIQCSAA